MVTGLRACCGRVRVVLGAAGENEHMGKGKSDKRRGGREQSTAAILDAAEKLFSERGFTAVSVRDIAAEAGVSHALVHRYLGSKQDVYRAMLVRRRGCDPQRGCRPRSDLLDGDEPHAAGRRARPAALRAPGRALRPARPVLRADASGGSRPQSGWWSSREAAAASEGDARDPDALDPRFVDRLRGRACSSAGSRHGRDWVLRAAACAAMSDDEFVDRSSASSSISSVCTSPRFATTPDRRRVARRSSVRVPRGHAR